VGADSQILELSALYLASISTLSVSTLGAADGTVGLGANVNGLLDRFSYGVFGRQMWADDGQNDDEHDVLSPASRGSTRLDLSLSYALAAGPRLGLRASWHRQ
jgi:hypothetical protein